MLDEPERLSVTFHLNTSNSLVCSYNPHQCSENKLSYLGTPHHHYKRVINRQQDREEAGHHVIYIVHLILFLLQEYKHTIVINGKTFRSESNREHEVPQDNSSRHEKDSYTAPSSGRGPYLDEIPHSKEGRKGSEGHAHHGDDHVYDELSGLSCEGHDPLSNRGVVDLVSEEVLHRDAG